METSKTPVRTRPFPESALHPLVAAPLVVEPKHIFNSTKTYTHSQGLSCAFRQWRADSHCKYLHGYALSIKLIFQGELDNRNWVQDFGALKGFKQWAEDNFDHKTLIALDDPQLGMFEAMGSLGIVQLKIVDAVGCERFAQMIMEAFDLYKWHGSDGRVTLESVEVREHEGNSAICRKNPNYGG